MVFPRLKGRNESSEAEVPLAGSRAENMHRLQVGLFGLAAMIMMIGLADIVIGRLRQSEATTVPEAASTAPAQPSQTAKGDPFAEAGVMPEIPSAAETGNPAPGPANPPAEPEGIVPPTLQ